MNSAKKVAIDIDGRTITLELLVAKQTREKMTVNHERIGGYPVLSISGYAQYRPHQDYAYCGQIYDELTPKNIKKYLIPKHRLEQIRKIWKEWHLNDMNAGCVHQGSVEANNNKWEELAQKETDKCPHGYRYGSSWLVRLLPQPIAEKIEILFN